MKLALRETAYWIALFLCLTIKAFAQADGTLDISFDPGTGFNGDVRSLLLQPDGKIIAGGYFTRFNDSACSHLARLATDGSRDFSFNSQGLLFDGNVSVVKLQTDGKILAAGDFTRFGNTVRNRIVRLNADGSLDASFDPGNGLNAEVISLALQPDGKIIIGGRFTQLANVSRKGIARLNANGSLDTSFDPGSGFEGFNMFVNTITLRNDQVIYVGGRFTTYNGWDVNNVIGLNPDGTINTSPTIALSAFNSSVLALELPAQGGIWAVGYFDSCYSVKRSRVALFNSNWGLDASFVPEGSGFDYQPYAMQRQPDGKILITGNFEHFNTRSMNGILRLNPSGSLDTTFDIGTGLSGNPRPLFYGNCLALQADGKVLVAGGFIQYNGVPRNSIARLHNSSPTSTKEALRFTLSPNPAHPGQTLHLSEAGNTLHLTDIQGRSVATLIEREAGQYMLPGDIVPGYYLLTSERGQRFRLCVAPQ